MTSRKRKMLCINKMNGVALDMPRLLLSDDYYIRRGIREF